MQQGVSPTRAVMHRPPLTCGEFDFQGGADQGHQRGREVDRQVLGRDGHVHPHQALQGGRQAL